MTCTSNCLYNLLSYSKSKVTLRSSALTQQQSVRAMHLAWIAVFLCVSVNCASVAALAAGFVEQPLSTVLSKHNIGTNFRLYNVDLLTTEVAGKKLRPGEPVLAKNFDQFTNGRFTWPASQGTRYSVFLVDLDSTNQHSDSSANANRSSSSSSFNLNNPATVPYNLYTAINVMDNSLASGQTIAPFNRPHVECQPGKVHRILFVAAQQEQALDLISFSSLFSISGSSKNRENIDLPELLNQHSLSPVAANLFLAQGEKDGVCSTSTGQYQLFTMQSVFVALTLAASFMAALRPTPYH